MTSDAAPSLSESNPTAEPLTSDRYSQVHLKSDGEKLLLILPKPTQADPLAEWSELWQDCKYCLTHHERTWISGTAVHLVAHDRLLDSRQLQNIAEAVAEIELKLTTIRTSRRQTAVAAATAGYCVEQELANTSLITPGKPTTSPLAEPLYLKTPIRSGAVIRHPGSIIILGDINPGGQVVADGDILVWGWLRGIAHAGARGNQGSRIMALTREPTQLRIADVVARVANLNPQEVEPEVAYIAKDGIRITPALNFAKTYEFAEDLKVWSEKKSEMIQYVNAQKLLEEKLKKVEKDS